MTLREYHIVFPEGETQEISGRLSIGSLVDCNGTPLSLPLPTNRMLVYRVCRVRTVEEIGLEATMHYLDQVSSMELLEFT